MKGFRFFANLIKLFFIALEISVVITKRLHDAFFGVIDALLLFIGDKSIVFVHGDVDFLATD